MDWMLPDAWDVEHNKLHHYFLSEDKDPDLVERNFEMLRDMQLPVWLKYAAMLPWFATWKAGYYSPNTFKELELSREASMASRCWPQSHDRADPLTVIWLSMAPGICLSGGHVQDACFWLAFALQWLAMVMPMAFMMVAPGAAPLTLAALGMWPFELAWQRAAWKAAAVGVVADALTNIHTFVIIACNHSGGDMYRYSTSCKAYSAEWFLRCAYSSVNFETGNDLIDGVYGWLNYQIEHHMFPDMTPLQYRKLQPLIRSVCKKHGVQYVQQNAIYRCWKMLRVAVGDDSMKCCKTIIDPTLHEKPLTRQSNEVTDAAIGS